jgi:hypothetical protein
VGAWGMLGALPLGVLAARGALAAEGKVAAARALVAEGRGLRQLLAKVGRRSLPTARQVTPCALFRNHSRPASTIVSPSSTAIFTTRVRRIRASVGATAVVLRAALLASTARPTNASFRGTRFAMVYRTAVARRTKRTAAAARWIQVSSAMDSASRGATCAMEQRIVGTVPTKVPAQDFSATMAFRSFQLQRSAIT